ncbi:MAG: 5-oxoprolinase subunit PxpB [Solobacterium sp.]|nr:5-oxoprolinase subunit PxpB [Solobacterium sp.]
MYEVVIKPCGGSALLIQFEQKIDPSVLQQVTAVKNKIAGSRIPGILDMIPAYASLMILYDPAVISFQKMKERILSLDMEGQETVKVTQRRIEIPVLYGPPFPEDLAFVALCAAMSTEEVIGIHTANEYPVYMIGFLPGFPYLGNLDERIHTPRRKEPRTHIPAGSVGIGGAQTGVYPVASPGGWHIIGKTPLKLYDPEREDPVLLRSGDLVTFRSITKKEFDEIERSGGRICL